MLNAPAHATSHPKLVKLPAPYPLGVRKPIGHGREPCSYFRIHSCVRGWLAYADHKGGAARLRPFCVPGCRGIVAELCYVVQKMRDNSLASATALEIVEVLSDGAGPINDDRAGFSGSTCWVIDGATDTSAEKLLPGGSDAAWLAERFSESFAKLAQKSEHSLADLVRDATALVARSFEAEHIRPPADRSRHPSAAACILRLRNGIGEVLGMGDSQLLYSAPGEAVRLCGARREQLGDRRAIARIRAHAAEHNLTWNGARAALHPQMSRGRARMNIPGGYAVLSIDMAPDDLITQERLIVPKGARFLLMTDGFARLSEVFAAYTDESLLEAAFQRGLRALCDELRALENADAECERVPRMKPHDDASAVLARSV